MFESDTVAGWLAERQNATLPALQAEALQWLIEQEKRIGFPDESAKEWALYPLERELEHVRKAISGGM